MEVALVRINAVAANPPSDNSANSPLTNGAASVDVAVPADGPLGAYSLGGLCALEDMAIPLDEIPLTVEDLPRPTVTADPAVGEPDTPVTLTGTNCVNGDEALETVAVTINDDTGPLGPAINAPVAADGTWTIETRRPASSLRYKNGLLVAGDPWATSTCSAGDVALQATAALVTETPPLVTETPPPPMTEDTTPTTASPTPTPSATPAAPIAVQAHFAG